MIETVKPILEVAMTFLPIALIAMITGGCATVFFRAIRASEPDSGPGGHAYQAMLFAAVMDIFLLAGMGISKFLELVIHGWGAIVGVVMTLFGGWLAYKGTVAIKSPTIGEITSTPAPPKVESGGV